MCSETLKRAVYAHDRMRPHGDVQVGAPARDKLAEERIDVLLDLGHGRFPSYRQQPSLA
jgi:hypothetical protein